MNQFLVSVLLACIAGSQFQFSDAQSLGTMIRIQSCNDNAFIGIPPKKGPATTTTTEAPTTTTNGTTTTTTAPVDVTTTTTTPAPAIVEPTPGGGSGGLVVYWKVSWASATGSGGSVIVASDTTTTENRCLGPSGDEDIAVTDSPSLPSESTFIWNFVAIFDSVTWTYKYKITSKKDNRCLRKIKNGKFSMSKCPSGSDIEFLYNILS